MNAKTKRFILILILSCVAFFALTLPFHRLLALFTVSEVRPSAVLYPFLGISFGLPAALGIMIANFISDAVNGYSAAVLLEGVIPQFFYTYVPYLLWRRLTRGEDHIHRLDSLEKVMKFVFVCLVAAVMGAIGVGLIVYFNFGADGWRAGFFVFLNNFDISVILGCPLMIISNQIFSRRSGTERTVTFNERVIIGAAAAEVVSLSFLIPVMYRKGVTLWTYDTWNTIYLAAVVVLNCILLASLIVMLVNRHSEDDEDD